MRWLKRLFDGKAHRVESVERRTSEAAQEAERVRKMVENYRRTQDALRR